MERADPPTNEPLGARMRRQAQACADYGSPLYEALLMGAAGDLEAGGPTAQALAGHDSDPAGSVPPLRLMGALHRLVLERRAPALATHYPSVGGTAGTGGAWDAARAVIAEQAGAVRTLLDRPVQTNEPGRLAVLYGGLACIVARTGLPVRLCEVGASGGLNLRPDQAAYIVDGEVRGEPGSALRLVEPWSPGPRPPAVGIHVVERAGCDLAPVDPTTTEGRLTLTSYVWADMPARLERLRAALALAATEPVQVVAATASAFLREQLAAATEGVVTVLWHSVVLQYLTPLERLAVDGHIDRALASSTARAPVAHLAMEGVDDRTPGGDYRFVLTLRLGLEPATVLADCHGHGPPVSWRPEAARMTR